MDRMIDMIDALTEAKLIWNPADGGLFVTKVEGGFLVHRLSADLKDRRMTSKMIEELLDVLEQRFPALHSERLERQLVRNSETLRRGEMLEARMANHEIRESLDARPLPNIVDARKAEELPMLYAVLDDALPKSPSLIIYGSEFSTGARRADEAMMIISIPPRLARKIKSREITIKAALTNLKAVNPRVFYLDYNAFIDGAERLAHHVKSAETMGRFVETVMNRFSMNVADYVTLLFTDEWMMQPGLRFHEGGAVDVTRMKPGFLEPGRKDFRFVIHKKLAVVVKDGVRTLREVANAGHTQFIKGLSSLDEQVILKKLDDVVKALEKAILGIK